MNSLIREVNNAVYQNIDDVVAFVKWLDDELCFLVSYFFLMTVWLEIMLY